MKEKEEREGGTSNNGIATAAFAEFKATGFSERVRETRMRLGVVCLWPFSPFPSPSGDNIFYCKFSAKSAPSLRESSECVNILLISSAFGLKCKTFACDSSARIR